MSGSTCCPAARPTPFRRGCASIRAPRSCAGTVPLKPRPGNADTLELWIAQVHAADLPHLHAFTRGPGQDRDAATAAFTLPYHNGGTEGVTPKTELIARQMYGRAGFPLLRHRVLLGRRHPLPPPEVGQGR